MPPSRSSVKLPAPGYELVSVTVSGTVTGHDGEPLPDVYVSYSRSGQNFSVTTDEDGRHHRSDLGYVPLSGPILPIERPFRLEFDAVDYDAEAFEIEADGPVVLNVELREDDDLRHARAEEARSQEREDDDDDDDDNGRRRTRDIEINTFRVEFAFESQDQPRHNTLVVQ